MIINNTPHAVRIINPDGSLFREIPSCGIIARVSVSLVPIGETEGISLVRGTYGQVTGLASSDPGTLYLVSTMVRAALPARKDLASPTDLVRDATGNVVGCRSLEVNP